MAAKKKVAHVGSTLKQFIKSERARDPDFAVEFDALQLARRIRAVREARGVSQVELAGQVGTKQPAIARLESGRVVPKLDLLARVAKALRMRLEVRLVEE